MFHSIHERIGRPHRLRGARLGRIRHTRSHQASGLQRPARPDSAARPRTLGPFGSLASANPVRKTQNARGLAPGVRVTKFAGPGTASPPSRCVDPIPHFPARPFGLLPSPPSLARIRRCGWSRPVKAAEAIHPIERGVNKAPSRRSMDFETGLWLSCNKVDLHAALPVISEKDRSHFG